MLRLDELGDSGIPYAKTGPAEELAAEFDAISGVLRFRAHVGLINNW
jgi:hypothetical protein